VGTRGSKEKEFRRGFLAALDEVADAFSGFGFEIKGPGGYSLRWNDTFELATNIRESKRNRFGADEFEVLFSIWMMEDPDRFVRGIWLPIPREWTFNSPEQISGVAGRLLDGVLRSAVPLAGEEWGLPSREEVASVASKTPLDAARELGGWHIPDEEP
jgi:hypothetical protein